MQHNFGNVSISPSNSPTSTTPTIKKRPPLALLKRGGSVVPSPDANSSSSSREGAFSFHQNVRTVLLFGKNNVFAYDGEKDKSGYLSLLQDANRLLILKWTPNPLLHSDKAPKSPRRLSTNSMPVSVKMEAITHLHLHQNEESKSIFVVLIDSDGVQQFSFKFTMKQYCLTFLNALEVGLSPLFRIEPSLDSIKTKGTILSDESLQQNKADELANSNNAEGHKEVPNAPQSLSANNATTNSGLVFRIVSFASVNFVSTNQKNPRSSRTISRASTQDSKGEDQTELAVRDSLALATRAIRNQIVGRAFYGWLSYCRHMRTIRTNLANIVTATEREFPMEPDEPNLPVNEVFWKICRSEKTIPIYKQFLTRVYFCGIEPDLRPVTWPYLLRIVEWHEDFGMDKMRTIKVDYEKDTLEWMELERELALRERDGLATDFSRQNSEYNDLVFKDFPAAYSNSVSSDVFDDFPLNLNEVQGSDEKTLFMKEFAANLSRIQKDVDRCDRATRYYSKIENLEVLRKVMCTYVYRRLKLDQNDGYVQGMCDLLAPLLVVFGDDALTLAAFEQLMKRMGKNFPQNKHAGGMEENLNYFRCLVEVMEPELYAQLMRNVDYSFVVFYRWLLLDFKRELLYNEIFQLWEVIWAADVVYTRHFGLFFGLALMTQYREILIENEMDFTDVIKFFNEMAEKHDVQQLLVVARKELRAFQEIAQDLVERKN